MVFMLMYDKDPVKMKERIKTCRDIFAKFSEEKLEVPCFCEQHSLEEFFKQSPLVDLACIRIRGEKEIELLRAVRRQYAQSDFFLIADHTISPMEYLTPDIRAASLLLWPYQEKEQTQVLKTFLQDFFNHRDRSDTDGAYVVENQSGKVVIPYDQIYYVEVRERKVFIRLRNKEYSRYDSLENVMKQLSDTFIRCHRSFVFNTRHLDKVRLSENTIYLDHGMILPLSRKYKPAVKEYVNGLRSV